jgi:RNA polymerase sigma-32 factor
MPSARRRRTSPRRPTAALPPGFAAAAPLGRAEETELARQYRRTREPELAHRLVRANLRLVLTIANEYAGPGRREHLDLIQEGCLGLMEAAERFDPERGVRFISYAAFWVRAFMLRYNLDSARLVRVGRSRADRKAFFRGERPPAELSLQAPASAAPDAPPLGDHLADADSVPADVALAQAQLSHLYATSAVAFERTLPHREAAVFRDRFLKSEPLPLQQIAARFSVSKERIRQVERNLADSFEQQLSSRLLPGARTISSAERGRDRGVRLRARQANAAKDVVDGREQAHGGGSHRQRNDRGMAEEQRGERADL